MICSAERCRHRDASRLSLPRPPSPAQEPTLGLLGAALHECNVDRSIFCTGSGARGAGRSPEGGDTRQTESLEQPEGRCVDGGHSEAGGCDDDEEDFTEDTSIAGDDGSGEGISKLSECRCPGLLEFHKSQTDRDSVDPRETPNRHFALCTSAQTVARTCRANQPPHAKLHKHFSESAPYQ